jgi:hypothetical protein
MRSSWCLPQCVSLSVSSVFPAFSLSPISSCAAKERCPVDGWLACKALDSFCYRSSWRVVPVRNDYGEGNGGSKDEKGKNKGDKDFHGVQPIGLWGLGRLTQIKFVLDWSPCLAPRPGCQTRSLAAP